MQETKIKGYINIIGYKVTVDETIHPGKYGFRIDHDAYLPSPSGGASSTPREEFKPHYFSSDEKTVVRDWMKAIMKATIGRDYSRKSLSSSYQELGSRLNRTCHFVVQHPDNSTRGRSSYEPSPKTTVSGS